MPPRAFDPSGPFARGLISKAERHHESNPGAPEETKAKREWHASWSDTFTRTVKCALCPDWEGFTGTGPECREALAEHRLERHYE